MTYGRRGLPVGALCALGTAGLAAAPASGQHIVLKDMDAYVFKQDSRERLPDSTALQSRLDFLAHPERHVASYEAAAGFADCAVRYNRDRVEAYLGQAISKKAGSAVPLGEIVRRARGCVLTEVSFDGGFLEGALAEQLMLSDTASAAVAPAGDSDEVLDFLRAVPVDLRPDAGVFASGQLAAECRVGFAPAAARALVASAHDSAGERGALAALRAVTPQCDDLAAQAIGLTPSFERAFVSRALYQWSIFRRD